VFKLSGNKIEMEACEREGWGIVGGGLVLTKQLKRCAILLDDL
jgi:hypothetical protein